MLTISLRCDRWIDRAKINKIYVIIKIVNKPGKEEQYFLVAGESCKRGV